MKLAIVGGGSTYTPELIDGFARLRDAAADRGAVAGRPRPDVASTWWAASRSACSRAPGTRVA